MATNYNQIQWVIQRNLTNIGDLHSLKQGCDEIGVPYVEIVECGCLNSAGFYHADIAAIVSSVTDHFSTLL